MEFVGNDFDPSWPAPPPPRFAWSPSPAIAGADEMITFKDAMGALAVVITLVAYGIYVWQTLRGEARPHPLSWLIFGILTGTAYLVQRDEAAGAGSWVMGITAVVCLLLCLMSLWRGERAFPWYEWAFLLAAAMIFIFYLLSRQPTIAAVLAATVNVLGFGPTLTKAWRRPHSDSVTTFALNSSEIRAVVLRHGLAHRRHLRHAGGVGRGQRRGRAVHLCAAAAGLTSVLCPRRGPQ